VADVRQDAHRLRRSFYQRSALRRGPQTRMSTIEGWRDIRSGEMHWRTITSGKVTTIAASTTASRIADPTNQARVFSWLVCASYDDMGNAAVYDYRTDHIDLFPGEDRVTRLYAHDGYRHWRGAGPDLPDSERQQPLRRSRTEAREPCRTLECARCRRDISSRRASSWPIGKSYPL
jgi:virulence plasmid B protein